MQRYNALLQKVTDLYEAKDPGRNPWADWLWAHHVPIVIERAKKLAAQKGADGELAAAAALLHDVADVRVHRSSHMHGAESLRLAKELLTAAGYTAAEIVLVVDDAVALHSCHGGTRPASLEGQVFATADALAHLDSDFYMYATWALANEGKSLDQIKAWALPKLTRDFNDKICFDDVQSAMRGRYDTLRVLFAL